MYRIRNQTEGIYLSLIAGSRRDFQAHIVQCLDMAESTVLGSGNSFKFTVPKMDGISKRHQSAGLLIRASPNWAVNPLKSGIRLLARKTIA